MTNAYSDRYHGIRYMKSAYLRLWCALSCGTNSRTNVVGPNSPQIVKIVQKRHKAQESALPITLLLSVWGQLIIYAWVGD